MSPWVDVYILSTFKNNFFLEVLYHLIHGQFVAPANTRRRRSRRVPRYLGSD